MRFLSAPFRWLSRFSLFHSLRFRLTIVVLIGTLPALGLLLLTASQQREDALAEGQEEAKRLVRLAAGDQRRVFEQAEQLLTTIARLPEVQGEDSEVCSQLMGQLLEINTEFDNLGVVKRDGVVFCSGLPEDSSTIEIDDAFVERTFETGDQVIGTYQQSPLLEEPTVTYAAPVPSDDGKPARLVFVTLDLGALDTFAGAAEVPEGTVFSVYDRSGVLLLRYPAEEAAIGKSFADEPAVRRMMTDRTGASLRDLQDSELIYAGQWIDVREEEVDAPGAAFVITELPKASTVARADATFQENLSRLGLAALVAVALAWVGADLFMARDDESRKQVIADVYRVYETGDLQELDELIALDMIDRNPAPGQVQGLSGYKQVVARFRAAFPNGTIEPDELLADDDKVVAQVTLRGTHVSEFFGAAPSGEDVVAKGIETFRFANGLIVEMWSMFTPLSVVEHPVATAPESESEEPRRRNLFQRSIAFFTDRKSA